MADDPNNPNPPADLIPRSEAVKAFQARDEAKRQLRELQEAGLVLTPEQKAELDEIRAHKTKLEEEKLKRAGEWDKLKDQLAQQHNAALKTVTERAEAVERELQERIRGLAFAQASEWFGPTGKTILPPDVAETYFARYLEFGENRELRVKDLTGNVILDPATGRPMGFAQAIGVLIAQMPNRDAVLRGSGKTGSGSSGGIGGPVTDADLDVLLKRAQQGDAGAIKKLKQRQTSLAGMTGTLAGRAG